ncbi:putative ubiquitin-like-specific protease 1B [Lycium barbarum]|uniref:putative ubiquitin-like-specific protease 1B n=1 Tax=Lycium barbarum TaxID=112863 RepID=UPI00293F5B25|nr:putative ubiquitin-like-specific protease 1B [Lycium barbarum]
MGALTINKKRGNDFFSSNYKTPLSNFSNFDHQITKKLKLSINQETLVPRLQSKTSKSTVQRFLKYPNPINPIRREVHGPCRQSRFEYIVNYKGEMGSSTSKKYEGSKRSDLDKLRCFKKDSEVIDIDDDDDDDDNEEVEVRGCEKNVEILDDDEEMEAWGCEKNDVWGKNVEILDDDEEIEAWGCEKNDVLGKNVEILDDDEEMEAWGCVKNDLYKKDVEILDGYDGKDPSVVTTSLDDENLKEESVGKLIDSLAVERTSDSYFYVPLYKKLLGSVEKISDKLKRIQFQIGYNEKRLETSRLLRPQKKGEKVKEDVVEEAFVPLTEEEEDEVSRAFSKSNWRRVLVNHENSNIDITGEKLQCLRPGQWLNDEVINVYLELLKEREKREPQKFLKCHFFNTFFYKKLISGQGGYNYQSVRRWTSQRKLGYSLLECDKIFVPIHKEIHWCLAVINKKEEKFQYLDSLRGRDSNVLKVLARYFVDEVKDKSGKHIDVSSWEQEFVEDLPVQKNGYDCGVFMIKNADFYSRDIGLCFNQEHMPYFRLRTAKELLRLKAD